MPIDPSIAMGYRPTTQLEDPSNQLAKILGIQQAQQALQSGEQAMQANRLKFDEYQRGVERGNRFRDFLMGNAGLDDDAIIKRYKASEFQDEGAKFQEGVLKRRETESKTQFERAQAYSKLLGAQKDIAGYVMANPTPENAMSALDHMEHAYKATNFDPSPITAQRQILAKLTTPEQIKEWAAGHALSAEKMLHASFESDLGGAKQFGTVDPLTGARTVLGTNAKTQTPDSVASVAATMRGQNMTDARAREQLAQQGWQFDTERGIAVNPKTGETRQLMQGGIPLGPKDKPLTDAQSKANLFGTRMKESDRILTALEGQYSPGAVNAKMAAGDMPLIGGVTGYAGNLMLSDQGQQAEQAQRDFINAVLRRESGAVISPGEFTNAQKQYFPQPGDSLKVLAQKKANRTLAIKGLEAEVPGGFKNTPSLTAPGNSGGAAGEWSIQRVP